MSAALPSVLYMANIINVPSTSVGRDACVHMKFYFLYHRVPAQLQIYSVMVQDCPL